jgi:S1-C subfamily serine protease
MPRKEYLAKPRELISRRNWSLLLLFTIAQPFPVTVQGQGPTPNLTPAQIAQAAIPSVVLIRTPTGVGSGFVAAKDGKVVTNFHVIRNAAQAVVETSDGAKYKDVEVIALDETRDLAVLRIRAPGLKPLSLGDSALSKPGEHVVAIGNPLGLGNTVSDGLLSGIRNLKQLALLQISAPISPGSSGGPVFNDHGEVIGVSTLLLTGGQNLNFAIPINAVKTMLSGDKGKPLATYAATSQHRDIPDHPLSLLNHCPTPQLQTVVGAISQAINVGAPLYNQGNIEACYRIYEGAALEVQRTVLECPGPKKALADGISHAEKLSTWSDKAWAMRDSFDGIIALAQKSGGGASASASAIQRHVPQVPPSVIDECPSEDVTAIASSIDAAINSGAPLYNSGNIEACFRIYEGAISEIDRKFSRCPAARQVLQTGVSRADQLDGWAAKAWALRDSFDGLTNAIVKKQADTK